MVLRGKGGLAAAGRREQVNDRVMGRRNLAVGGIGFGEGTVVVGEHLRSLELEGSRLVGEVVMSIVEHLGIEVGLDIGPVDGLDHRRNILGLTCCVDSSVCVCG